MEKVIDWQLYGPPRQRAEAKAQYRRNLYKASLDAVTTEESLALRRKHDLPIDGSSSDFRT